MCGCGSKTPPNVDVNAFNPCKNIDKPCDECEDCGNSGCSAQLDPSCIIYGLNQTTPALPALGINSGDSFTIVLEKLEAYAASSNPFSMEGIALGYLSTKYQIQTFKDLMEALIEELEDLRNQQPSTDVSKPCFTFTIKNTSSTQGFYKVRQCNGILVTNQIISPGETKIVQAQGAVNTSANVEVNNNGII